MIQSMLKKAEHSVEERNKLEAAEAGRRQREGIGASFRRPDKKEKVEAVDVEKVHEALAEAHL